MLDSLRLKPVIEESRSELRTLEGITGSNLGNIMRTLGAS